MQGEFKIPGQEPQNNQQPEAPSVVDPALPSPQLSNSNPPGFILNDYQAKKRRKKLFTVLIMLLAGAFVAFVALSVWFVAQLQPLDPDAKQRRVMISPGTPLLEMSNQLKSEGIIRSSTAFHAFIRLNGLQGRLQAGTYVLSPSQSVQDIAAHLVEGKVDAFRITIVPGQNMNELRESLLSYGFSSQNIDEAFVAEYNHPLLSTKPANASLEGYVFPDTYEIQGDGSVQNLFIRAFDEFYDRIKKEQIVEKLSTKGVSLHQGITAASIIQMEVSDPEDQKKVSQVIWRRLDEKIALGMDSTSVFAAKQKGIAPSTTVIVNIDSPYNTRKNLGLPPGPIANFNFSALLAAANPAPGNYLYFVSGDDGTNYFSETLAEHEEKVARYCTDQCR